MTKYVPLKVNNKVDETFSPRDTRAERFVLYLIEDCHFSIYNLELFSILVFTIFLLYINSLPYVNFYRSHMTFLRFCLYVLTFYVTLMPLQLIVTGK